MAKAVDDPVTYLTPQIVTAKDNLLFHSERDNVNKIFTNVTGSNVVNSAAGTMVQEQKNETTSSVWQTQPMLDRSKERSLKLERPTVLPPKVICKRTGLLFPEAAVLSPPPANDTKYSLRTKEHLLRFSCR